MKNSITIPKYSLSEEIINSVTHGIASGLCIWWLVIMIIKASHDGGMAITTVTLFGASAIILYTISCIYHALSKNLTGKKVLRVIDHCDVFLLVYGTIIPSALLGIGGVKGWICFGIVTLVTLLGIINSCIALEKSQVFEVVCHLVNGWSMIIYSNTLIHNIGFTGFKLIVFGGVAYTVGAVLYGLGSKKKYMHSVFHIFCILGTFLHFLAIYLYML